MNRRPKLELLDRSRIERIIDQALELLSRVGVFVENKPGLKLLDEAGAKIDRKKKRVYIRNELVQKCLRTAPGKIEVYDRQGNLALDLQGYNVHFDPGSAALWIYDLKKIRSGSRSPLI